MRKYYILLFCAWICTMCVNLTSQAETIYNDSTLQNLHYGESGHGDTPSISDGYTPSISEWISILTLTVNDINNLIAAENNLIATESKRLNIITVIIGLASLLAAFGGVTWYKKTRQLQINIEDTKKKVEEQQIAFEAKHEYSLENTRTINLYLYKITNTIVDSYDNGSPGSPSPTPTNSKPVRETLMHDYYMVALLLPYSEGETEAAFDYIATNGTLDVINDLEEIAKTDPDERKRNRAREVIGYIKGRLG